MSSEDFISLFKLNDYIRQVIDINFDEWIKVKAEINQINESRGHFYLELVEKDPDTDVVVARQSAVMWRNNAIFLKRKYPDLFYDLFQAGNELVFSSRVDFHPKYGMKLVIQDVDAEYTLGELEKKKRETIARLKASGMLELNKRIAMPPVIQRIAVISSRTAAGYADFINQLFSNPYGHAYRVDLYHSAVQGVATVKEVTNRLKDIAAVYHKYDAICIIRGGGSRIDLAAFDEYEIAAAIAQSPLPVITGIGHEVDTSVADMVSREAVKTPTAAASLILHHNDSFLNEVWNNAYKIIQSGKRKIGRQMSMLDDLGFRLHARSERYFSNKQRRIELLQRDLAFAAQKWISQLTSNLDKDSIRLHHLRPDRILERGYSITMRADRVIRAADELKNGDTIKSVMANGVIYSKVKQTKDDE